MPEFTDRFRVPRRTPPFPSDVNEDLGVLDREAPEFLHDGFDGR